MTFVFHKPAQTCVLRVFSPKVCGLLRRWLKRWRAELVKCWCGRDHCTGTSDIGASGGNFNAPSWWDISLRGTPIQNNPKEIEDCCLKVNHLNFGMIFRKKIYFKNLCHKNHFYYGNLILLESWPLLWRSNANLCYIHSILWWSSNNCL